MSFEHPSGETIFTVLASAVSGGGLMKALDLIFGRKGREVKALGDTIKIMGEQQTRFDHRLDVAEKKVDECHDQHEACEAGRREDREQINALRAEIARMKGGDQLPAYHLNAPKGDPGKGEGR